MVEGVNNEGCTHETKFSRSGVAYCSCCNVLSPNECKYRSNKIITFIHPEHDTVEQRYLCLRQVQNPENSRSMVSRG